MTDRDVSTVPSDVAQAKVDAASAGVDRVAAEVKKWARIRTWMLGVLCVVVFLSVVGLSAIQIGKQDDQHATSYALIKQVEAIAQRVQEQTDPNSAYSQNNARALEALVADVERCLEVHGDQNNARNLGKPIPATPPGCPVDRYSDPTP
jgi:hypothetical protein